jgi:hypothetical protein
LALVYQDALIFARHRWTSSHDTQRALRLAHFRALMVIKWRGFVRVMACRSLLLLDLYRLLDRVHHLILTLVNGRILLLRVLLTLHGDGMTTHLIASALEVGGLRRLLVGEVRSGALEAPVVALIL